MNSPFNLSTWWQQLKVDSLEHLNAYLAQLESSITGPRILELIVAIIIIGFVLKALPPVQVAKISKWLSFLFIILIASEALGLSLVFYLVLAMLVTLTFAFIFFNLDLLAAIFHVERTTLAPSTRFKKVSTEIVRAVKSLATNHKPSLIVLFPPRSTVSKSFLTTSKAMHMPVTAEAIVEVFKDADNPLSKGALLIHKDLLVAGGSTLGATGKRFVFGVRNVRLVNFAKRFGVMVILTSGNSSQISILYKQDIYHHATPEMIERLINNLMFSS